MCVNAGDAARGFGCQCPSGKGRSPVYQREKCGRQFVFCGENALLENGLIYDFQFRHNAQDWTKQPAVSTPMQQPTLPHLKEPSDPFASKAEPEVESPPPPQTIYPTQYHYDIGETMAALMPEETRPAALENPQAEHIESKPELESSVMTYSGSILSEFDISPYK